MRLNQIGEDFRVPVKPDECGEHVIKGRNGHLYTDAGRVMVMFTDDGRKKPFTVHYRNKRLKLIQPWVKRMTQDGTWEFTVEIEPVPEAIRTALFRVLLVKRYRPDKGISYEPRFPIGDNLRKKAIPGVQNAPEAPGP